MIYNCRHNGTLFALNHIGYVAVWTTWGWILKCVSLCDKYNPSSAVAFSIGIIFYLFCHWIFSSYILGCLQPYCRFLLIKNTRRDSISIQSSLYIKHKPNFVLKCVCVRHDSNYLNAMSVCFLDIPTVRTKCLSHPTLSKISSAVRLRYRFLNNLLLADWIEDFVQLLNSMERTFCVRWEGSELNGILEPRDLFTGPWTILKARPFMVCSRNGSSFSSDNALQITKGHGVQLCQLHVYMPNEWWTPCNLILDLVKGYLMYNWIKKQSKNQSVEMQSQGELLLIGSAWPSAPLSTSTHFISHYFIALWIAMRFQLVPPFGANADWNVKSCAVSAVVPFWHSRHYCNLCSVSLSDVVVCQ